MPKTKEEHLLFETNKNIFLTGKAGTGKTYLIKRYVEKMESEGKAVLVCAPTGTAAVNAGGETCHSLFNIPIPCYGVSISKTPPSKIKVLASADTIIVDEVSMLRNDAFSYMIRVVRKAEREKGSKIRMILTGDFSQLPPVVSKTDVKNLKKFKYDTSGYAFTAKEWEDLHLTTIELTEIHRQDELEFTENLAKIRTQDLSALPYFNKLVKDFGETDEEKIKGYLSSDCVVLCGTNALADEINRQYLESLPGNITAYQAQKTGRVSSDSYEQIVLLKKGAKVMFTVNDVVKGRYQNGTFGIVTDLYSDHAVVKTEDGKLINVYPYEYKAYSYTIKQGELTKKELGSVKQLPIKIAAAITIHKSQGKTFEKAVISPEVFAHGQLYVALSRLRSSNGLILTSQIRPEHLKSDEIVDRFYKDGYTYKVKKAASSTTKPSSATKKAPTTKKKTTSVKKKTSTTKKKTSTTAKKTASSKKTKPSVKKTKSSPSKKAKPPVKKAKSPTRKTSIKKPSSKKTTAKKSVTKKPVSKKTTSSVKKTKAPAKRASAKKTKTPAKRSSVKKAKR